MHATRAYTSRGTCVRARTRAHLYVYAGAMLSCTCVEKKRPGARAGGRGREDVDIFLRATRECRERHAFDWPRVVGEAAAAAAAAAAGDHGTRMRGEGDSGRRGGGGGRGWRGWSTLCRRFFGAFFYGRRPSLAWMNEHGEEHQ